MRMRLDPTDLTVHRRAFLGRAARGVGAVALASLLDPLLLRARAQPAPGASRALISTGLAPAPEGIDAAELAAWTHVARVLLNLHEMVTRS